MTPPDAVRERYERYYTEKIWELIPEFARTADGLAPQPDGLRSLVTVLAKQAAVLRLSNDRLSDDAFIDLCSDWAVPYIADLVGTRLVSSLNTRGRRVDVAKTIYYRRRKGTVRVLEELISDITGWDGVVVEEFRRLTRCWHKLDPDPDRYRGFFTGTPPGGIADLRRPRGTELAGGPFDEFSHLPDVRMQRGHDGVYNIPRIAFHLYRLGSYRVQGVTPMPGPGATAFTFDPSGRDVPLFAHRHRAEQFDWDQWRSAREWELPAPIRCRVLGQAESKAILWGESIDVQSPPGTSEPAGSVRSGQLSSWTSSVSGGVDLVVDPERGRMLFVGANAPALPPAVTYHYGFSGDVGAGSYERRDSLLTAASTVTGPGPIAATAILTGAPGAVGVTELADSSTFGPVDDPADIVSAQIQAANFERPYVRLAGDWHVNGADSTAELTIDGLWIGGAGAVSLILGGSWSKVTLRHCTLDPGGTDAQGHGIAPVALQIAGDVADLEIDRSILGPIAVAAGSLERLTISDSIVQSDAATAIDVPGTRAKLRRVTILGDLIVDRLDASEALITGVADVTDTQDGCFRFGAWREGGRVPHPYHSYAIRDLNHYFTSRHFGAPGYAQLSETAPLELRTGAENGCEVGAFNFLIGQLRLDGLMAKIDEYMPFGLIPVLLFET